MNRYRADSQTGGVAWPSPRLATWAANNGITTRDELKAWILNATNVGNLAQARAVLAELAVALFDMVNLDPPP